MSIDPSADFVSPAPAASPPASEPAPQRVPQFNVYMVMLGLAFLFICLACLFLAFELNDYDFKLKP